MTRPARRRKARMKPDKETLYYVELVQGVEGLCIYLNGYRIVGPKPWGGGPVIKRWQVSREDVDHALSLPQ